MLRFGHIEFLWGLLLVPLFIVTYLVVMQWKKKARSRFVSQSLTPVIIPRIAKGKPVAKLVLYCVAFTMLVIGLANPQMGTRIEEVKREGIDLVLALDVSNSMLAEDLSPNRLERSRMAIQQLVDRLSNDRMGLIVFAGQAYTQLPITTDYAAAKLFLSTVSTDIVPVQGTAIGAAIELGMSSFENAKGRSKAIIVITDGENHEDDAVKMATEAAKQGIVVHTIGMGSEQGAPIPIYRGGINQGYRSDREGNTVVSQLNEEMLKEIAAAGNGIYTRATNANAGLETIFDEINSMEKTEFGSKQYTDYEDRFQPFLLTALILLIAEFLISERRSRWVEKIDLFN